ncbi:MAG: hypothetical protein WCI30_03505 [Clostridia bacterium]
MNDGSDVRVRETIFAPTTINIITAAVWAGVIAVLQTLSMLGFSLSAIIVSLNIAVSLYVVSGLWFGVWGIIGSCIGMIIGNLIGGMPLSIVLLFQLCTIFEVALPMLAFRWFKCDPRLRDFKSIAIFLIFGALLNSAIGSLWSAWYVVLGQTAPELWLYAVLPSWFGGEAIGRAILGTLALLILTPFIQRFRGYVPNEPERWLA